MTPVERSLDVSVCEFRLTARDIVASDAYRSKRLLPASPVGRNDGCTAKREAAGGGDDLDAASFTTEMDALHDNVLNADERAQWAARPPETVLLKAGHVAFHHALTVHGSFGNRSDKPRRALVLNFFADGTKALMDGTLLKGAPAVAKGEPLQGKFHPLVFDASRVDMASLPVASV